MVSIRFRVRWTEYWRRTGVSWRAIRQAEAQRLFELVQRYAPNLPGAERLPFIQTPEDLERELGLPRGQIFHVDFVSSQSFNRRPIQQLGPPGEIRDGACPSAGLHLGRRSAPPARGTHTA